MRTPAKLLVLAYGHGLGDSILSVPLLRGVRASWPACRLVLATTAPTADWFRETALVDETLALARGRLWAHLTEVRRLRADCVVDLRLDHTVGSALFARLSGADLAVGFDCPLRGWWFHRSAEAGYRTGHHSESLRRLAGALGASWSPEPAPIREPARRRVESMLQEVGMAGARLAVLAPGGRDDVDRVDKRWPAGRYGELGARLLKEGFRVAVTGSADEADLCAWVAQRARASNLAGRTSCEELAALFARCQLVVGNNSGPVHLAAALGVPTVSFSGGVHLAHWRPLGAQARVILRDGRCAETLCRTCPDKGMACLEKIDVERVAQEAMKTLQEGDRRQETGDREP